MISGKKRIIGLIILALFGAWQAFTGNLSQEESGTYSSIIAVITLLLHFVDQWYNSKKDTEVSE